MLCEEEQPLLLLTRFPGFGLFLKEEDFMEWGHRLKIHDWISFDTFRV
jgi:hypothetical protein